MKGEVKDFMDLQFLTGRFGMGNHFEYLYHMRLKSALDPKALELKCFKPGTELSKITNDELGLMLRSSLVVDNTALFKIFTESGVFGGTGEMIASLLEIPGSSLTSYLIAPSDIVILQGKSSTDRLRALQRFRAEALYEDSHIKIDSIHFSEEHQCWIILVDSWGRNGQVSQMRSALSNNTVKLEQRYIYIMLPQNKDQKTLLYKQVAEFLDKNYATQKIQEGGRMNPGENHIHQIKKLDFLFTQKLGFLKRSPNGEQTVEIDSYNGEWCIKTMAHTDNAVMSSTLKYMDDDGFRPGDWAYCGYNGIGAYGDTVNLRPIGKDGALGKVFSYGFDKVFFVSTDGGRQIVPLTYVVQHPNFLNEFNVCNK